jgi:hypothetical protein
LLDGIGLRVAARENETQRQHQEKGGYQPETGVGHDLVRFYQTNRHVM